MDWVPKNKFEEIFWTVILLVYWVIAVPFIWLYDKLVRPAKRKN